MKKKLEKWIDENSFTLFELPIFSHIKNKKGCNNKNCFEKANYFKILSKISEDELILTEYDERILFGIMNASKLKNKRVFFTDYYELISHSGMRYDGSVLAKCKNSLAKLSAVKIVTRNIKTEGFTNEAFFLDSVEEHKVENIGNEFIPRSRRIKTVLEIQINEEFFNAISDLDFSMAVVIRKPLARRLYFLFSIYKKRTGKSELELAVLPLLAIIPLSIDEKCIRMSVSYLMEAMCYLSECRCINSLRVKQGGDLMEETINFRAESELIENNLRELYIGLKKDKNRNYSRLSRMTVLDVEKCRNDIIELILSLKKTFENLEILIEGKAVDDYYLRNDVMMSIFRKYHTIIKMADFIEEYYVSDCFERQKVHVENTIRREELIDKQFISYNKSMLEKMCDTIDKGVSRK